jgi:hypothetical protein
MATHAVGFGPEDPVSLVESCYRAVEWLLATHTAKGLLIPRPWIDHPYGEEEIALLEEELLPAMAVFLARDGAHRQRSGHLDPAHRCSSRED